MSDSDLIVRLLEALKKQEEEEQKKKKEAIDEDEYMAYLRHKVFGDPYPPKKNEKEE